ncbi:class I SAM-dependent methyltransferase [Kumtagia ephedrae]|uniref:Methyltransferase type 11 domain-containing protein n=1 Tax=Kumtagia ephedrae TaxID=2116701 RepID=A0A2P7SSB3_9HYPH|nr:methyltransferase domain-containing protein [Mesorhizobium ephedrae]PSJ65362.1 hypothetical protein C7I84_03190 [Mesorhizobium ephedrae]
MGTMKERSSVLQKGRRAPVARSATPCNPQCREDQQERNLEMVTFRCPICGGSEFVDDVGRKMERCTSCRSLKRTRAAALFVEKFVKLTKKSKILHFAPEERFAEYLASRCQDGYEMADVSRDRYQPLAERLGAKLAVLDLCKDAKGLPSDTYDLVIHNHVIEHVPCNWTIVLQQLHRIVKPGGAHLFSFPIYAKGYYREELDPAVSKDVRTKEYGRWNHVRRFGRKDLDRTLGAVFNIEGTEARDNFTVDELLSAGVTSDFQNLFFLRKPKKATAKASKSGPKTRVAAAA